MYLQLHIKNKAFQRTVNNGCEPHCHKKLACGHLMTGHMVVVSRAFSQFYFHCRVLPGSSGFDGSFEEQAFFL